MTCMCVLVTQSCSTLCDPMDCSLPGSSVHGISQARILEWVAISFSRGFFLTQGSHLGLLHCRWILYRLSQLRISPSNEYSGLISFRIDQFDLLADQGTLKSLFEHHSSKASILQCSPCSMVQLSHPLMTTGKTIALTISHLFAKQKPLE